MVDCGCYFSEDAPAAAAVAAAAAAAPAAPAAPGGAMDINTALQEVLKTALTHGSLAHGLHEAAKALDK